MIYFVKWGVGSNGLYRILYRLKTGCYWINIVCSILKQYSRVQRGSVNIVAKVVYTVYICSVIVIFLVGINQYQDRKQS